MTATQPVPKPPSRLEGHEGALVVVVLVAILAAIAKPWGAGSVELQPMGSAFSSPSETVAPSPTAAGYVFDADVYGPFEPTPEWSVWPAGYFVSVRFVIRASSVKDRPGNVDSQPDPLASGARSPLPTLALPESSSPATGPDWPRIVDIGPGEHLLWLGINTPRGWSVKEAVLRRVQPNGVNTVVTTTRLSSRWDDHFTILGIPTSPNAETLAVWPIGQYRLDLVVSPGDIEETIVIRVRTADDPAHEPPPSEPPSG